MQVRVDQFENGGVPCGCGRSASGFCDGSHAMSTEQWKAALAKRIVENTKPDLED